MGRPAPWLGSSGTEEVAPSTADAPAECAEATAVAENAAPDVDSNADDAEPAAVAEQPSPSVGATSTATSTTAVVEQASASVSVNAGCAETTAAAQSASANVSVNAGCAEVAAVAENAAVSTGFTDPTDIPGLLGWWDAADTGTITATGGSVDQWNDKSGNGRHLVDGATAPTTGATTINGLNVLDFSDDQLIYDAGSDILDVDPYTLVFVVRMPGTGVVDRFVAFVKSAGGNDFEGGNAVTHVSPTGDTTCLSVSSDGSGAVVDAPSNVLFRARTSKNGTTWTTAVDDTVDTATLASSTLSLVRRIYIGTTPTGAGFTGSLGEVALYNSVLSAGELDDLNDYLVAKWTPSASDANAQAAEATAVAEQAAASIDVNAGCAETTAVAENATVSTATLLDVSPTAAEATAVANQPAASITPTAATAETTATANPPTLSVAPAAQAAEVTGVAQSPTVSVAPTAASADSTGTANQPTASVSVNAGCAEVAAVAQDAVASTATLVFVNAQCAEVTATAHSPTASIAPVAVTSETSATAQPASASIAFVAATAEVSAVAQPATVVFVKEVSAGCAEVIGIANSPTAAIGVAAQVAAVLAEGNDAGVPPPFVIGSATTVFVGPSAVTELVGASASTELVGASASTLFVTEE